MPGFNCYSCPGAVGACPLGALQNAIAASGSRTPVYVLGILMLYGITLGRTICGYLCPLGLLQELVHKIPTFKVKKSRVTHVLSYLKYVIWPSLSLRFPFGTPCKAIQFRRSASTYARRAPFEGAIGLLSNPANSDKFSMLGILFTRKFVILLLITLTCVFIYRAFCRFLCPLGRDLRPVCQNRCGGRESGSAQVYKLRTLYGPVPHGHPPCGRSRVYPLRQVY